MAMMSFLQIQAGGEDAPVLFGEDATQNAVGGTDVSAWLECSAFEVALETGQTGARGAMTKGKRLDAIAGSPPTSPTCRPAAPSPPAAPGPSTSAAEPSPS